METQKTKFKSLIECPTIGICLIFYSLIISGCSTISAAPNAAPTVDTTALVAQISQTLEAKFTQQVSQLPSLDLAATLLPTAIVTNTPLPTPILPTLQASNMVTTLFPIPSPKPGAVLLTTSAPGAAIPPALFAVIHVITSVNHADISTSCPPGYTFQFSADISTNGPGMVTYNWEFSDNSKTNNQTLTFVSAATQVVTTDWNLGTGGRTPAGNPYKGWARITIVQPNNQVFTRAPFSFECK